MLSGKQILLHLLNKYSLQLQQKEDLEEVSESIRTGLLMHGSAPAGRWKELAMVEWGEERSEDEEEVIMQGLHVKGKNIPLSDMFEEILEDADYQMPAKVARRFPDLKQEEYEAATLVMALILSSVEWHAWTAGVENGGKMDAEALNGYLTAARKKWQLFREDPENYA